MRRARLPAAAIACAAAAPLAMGCAGRQSKVIEAGPQVNNVTFAVAPVLNFSGRFDFDPVQAADLLASELSTFEGANVLPVNRVVAYLASRGQHQIESPAHALAVCEAVGADAICVAGILEYDPYTPIVGLAVQVYLLPRGIAPGLDAVQAARQARPVAVRRMADSLVPAAQLQITLNAAHSDVYEAVRRYADPRHEGGNPHGWRQYLKVQALYLRFCWHHAMTRLLADRQWLEATSVRPEQMEKSA
jgi:hypothetical protein